jgi:hypothetical protein
MHEGQAQRSDPLCVHSDQIEPFQYYNVSPENEVRLGRNNARHQTLSISYAAGHRLVVSA